MESRLLARLTAYTPGEQPQERKYIKLNTNENPYPPCPKIGKRKINGADFRLYPDPDCRILKETLADTLRVPPSHIFTGNGSDEVLSFAFAAFFDADNGPVLFPEVTYSFYPVYCRFYGLPFRESATIYQSTFRLLRSQKPTPASFSPIRTRRPESLSAGKPSAAFWRSVRKTAFSS